MVGKVSVGVIGLGRMGRRHVEAYLQNPEIRLEACCDVNPEALRFLDTRNAACRKYTDWHEMLERETFDLLSIVTNGPSHAEITIAAAKKKVPRLISEKPMATSIRDAKLMIEATKASGTRLVINYSRRWADDYRRLRDLIRKGTIGNLCEVHCVCGGGQLACNGSHFFDLMRFLSDSEPVSVLGYVDKKGTPNPRGPQFSDPGGYGLVRFSNAMRGFVDMYEDLGIPPRIEIVGSIGRVVIDETKNAWYVESRDASDRAESLGKYDLPLKQRSLPSQPLDLQQLLTRAVLEILTDGSLSCSGPDGLAALQMVLGFHASDREGNVPLSLPLPSKYNDLTINFT